MILDDGREGGKEEMGTIGQQEKDPSTNYQAEKETWKGFALTNQIVKRDSWRFVLSDLQESVNVVFH